MEHLKYQALDSNLYILWLLGPRGLEPCKTLTLVPQFSWIVLKQLKLLTLALRKANFLNDGKFSLNISMGMAMRLQERFVTCWVYTLDSIMSLPLAIICWDVCWGSSAGLPSLEVEWVILPSSKKLAILSYLHIISWLGLSSGAYNIYV